MTYYTPQDIKEKILKCETTIEHLKSTCPHESLYKGPYGCASCYACGHEFTTQFCEESPNSMCKYKYRGGRSSSYASKKCEYCGSEWTVY